MGSVGMAQIDGIYLLLNPNKTKKKNFQLIKVRE